MKYEYIFTKVAAKDIQKLDMVIQKRIKQKLAYFIDLPDPLAQAKRLTGDKAGMYRWRLGDYRIVFDVDGNKIVILQVQHRKDIYKK